MPWVIPRIEIYNQKDRGWCILCNDVRKITLFVCFPQHPALSKGTCTNTTPGRPSPDWRRPCRCLWRTNLLFIIPGLMNCFVCQESARRVQELKSRLFNKSYFKLQPIVCICVYIIIHLKNTDHEKIFTSSVIILVAALLFAGCKKETIPVRQLLLAFRKGAMWYTAITAAVIMWWKPPWVYPSSGNMDGPNLWRDIMYGNLVVTAAVIFTIIPQMW